jgi:type VI secretion system secreted protein Hcp
MPTPAYARIRINGTDVEGSVEISGREGSMEIIEFTEGVETPIDPHSARTTGVRVHKPIKFVKAFDSSSPLLFKACVNSEVVDELVISWYRINDMGTEIEYFRHTITNGRIVGFRQFMYNAKDPTNAHHTHLEEISVLFQSVTLTYVDGAIEHTDDWLAEH